MNQFTEEELCYLFNLLLDNDPKKIHGELVYIEEEYNNDYENYKSVLLKLNHELLKSEVY